MKFIHVSDLHLGKRLHETSFLEDQEVILREILSVIDDNGRVDVDGLMEDLKQQIRNCPNGKVTIAIPMFGKYIFAESDIDELHRLIKEG